MPPETQVTRSSNANNELGNGAATRPFPPLPISADGSLEKMFSGWIGGVCTDVVPSIVEKELPAAIRRRLCESDFPPLRVVVENSKHELIAELPRQHYLFPFVVKLMNATAHTGQFLNVALVGPAGTGKTTMAINAAKVLSGDFVIQPFNPQTTNSALVGYMDVNGKYVSTPLYRAMKEGLTFIADEFDAANPAIATVLNTIVANRVATFPNNETVFAHQNFRIIVCMNTYGSGGDDQYTGRNRLDAATLDRFVYLHVPIDPGLEALLAGMRGESSPPCNIEEGGKFTSEREILNFVVGVRGAVEKAHKRYVISPRATLHAAAMHRAGFGRRWIEDGCIWKGMLDIDKTTLRRELKVSRED